MAGPQHPGATPLSGGQRPPFPPRAGGRRPPPSSGSSVLTALFYVFLTVLVVCGAAVGYLILNPPSDLIRRTVVEQVKAKTGRDLVVAGPASFTFYPGVGVSLGNVSLSGPPGADSPLIKMTALDVSVKAMPLFSREIAVERIVLTEPVFDLRIDKSGKRNWDFAEIGAVRYAQAETGVADDGGRRLPSRLAKIKALQLDDVRIENGTVRFSDERSELSQQVEAVNVKVSAPSLDAPVVAKGDLVWRGEKTDFDGELSTPRTLLEEKPAALKFKANNARVAASYDGAVTVKDGADLQGRISAETSSARELAGWLGTKLPPAAGFGPLSITGEVKTTGATTTLQDAVFQLDGAIAKGAITVTRGGARPQVVANLGIDRLDLNKYLTGEGATSAAPGSSPAPTKPAPAGQGGDQIEKLLNSPATKVYGAAHRDGWSSEPFNLALLGVADVDAKLAVGQLLVRDLTIGKSSIVATLKNRILKTQFDDIELYDGHGRGAVTIDGTGVGAGIGAAFALDGVSAQPLLKDAAKMSWLTGKAKVDLKLTAAGANQLQLVETLAGSAGFVLSDGAVAGFNLPGAIRGLSQGDFSAIRTAPSEKTDFSQMSANFAIQNGVAQNSDLQLVSPLLRVTGAGAVQLPQRTVDYTVKPKLVASLEGQQGASALSGIEVPVRIHGSWDSPKIETDLGGVDATKAVDAIKEIGKQYQGKNAGEIVDDLFKKDSSGSSKAKDLLNKFLKPKEQ